VVDVRVGRVVASSAGRAGPNEALQPTGAAVMPAQIHVPARRLNLAFTGHKSVFSNASLHSR
jgi:hypothetical protein